MTTNPAPMSALALQGWREIQAIAAEQRMTPAGRLLAALKAGHKPSSTELQDLAYALEGVIAEYPEIQWMPTSFESVGDSIGQAQRYMAWAGVTQ